MSYDLFKARKHYSFTIYPTGILGTGFEHVRVLSIMDETTARSFISTRELHAQVYPTLPDGTPRDPSDFTFIKVRKANGSEVYLALPWIREDSIVESGITTMRMTLANVTAEDRPRILQALAAINITAVELVENDT